MNSHKKSATIWGYAWKIFRLCDQTVNIEISELWPNLTLMLVCQKLLPRMREVVTAFKHTPLMCVCVCGCLVQSFSPKILSSSIWLFFTMYLVSSCCQNKIIIKLVQKLHCHCETWFAWTKMKRGSAAVGIVCCRLAVQ